jgi:hypothetical protein
LFLPSVALATSRVRVDNESVVVRIQCTKANGQAIVGVPFIVTSEGLSRASPTTNSEGLAEISIELTLPASIVVEVDSSPSFLGTPNGPPAIVGLEELSKKYCFQYMQSSVLEAGQSTVQFQFIMNEARPRRAVVLDHLGAPFSGKAFSQQPPMLAKRLPDGAFEFMSTDGSTGTTLELDDEEPLWYTKFLDLSWAADASSDVSLGTFTLTELPASAGLVTFHVQNDAGDVANWMYLSRKGVALVDESGTFAVQVSFGLTISREQYPLLVNQRLACIGKYYIVPGRTSRNELVHLVASSLRSGRLDRLITAGIPNVQIEANAVLNVDVDMKDLVERCVRLRTLP